MTTATTSGRNTERELARLVGIRVTTLQRGIDAESARTDSATRAALARLRRLDPGNLGADTDAWALTMDLLPPDLLGRTDQPNPAERASQAALVLYATHAQSARQAVHVRERPLGLAIRQLAEARDAEDPTGGPVMARFHSVARAQTYDQLMTHLRGIVQILRAESIPLDYGSLAADLYRWQQPGGIPIVRLRWGRGFHRTSTKNPSNDTPDTIPPLLTDAESETAHVR